jgi:co-chaperonin GroES (HSP10)
MTQRLMKHEEDPRERMLRDIGPLDGVEIFNNLVLVALYERPETTKGGIILPETAKAEDEYQGKVGLVVKLGPTAFKDPENKWFVDQDVKIGDWLVFHASDGRRIDLNNTKFRYLQDTAIKFRVDHPDRVW